MFPERRYTTPEHRKQKKHGKAQTRRGFDTFSLNVKLKGTEWKSLKEVQ